MIPSKNVFYCVDTGTWIQNKLDNSETVTYGDYAQYFLTQLQTLDSFFENCRYLEVTVDSTNTYGAIMLPNPDGTVPSGNSGVILLCGQYASTTAITATTDTARWYLYTVSDGIIENYNDGGVPSVTAIGTSTTRFDVRYGTVAGTCVKLEVYGDFYGIGVCASSSALTTSCNVGGYVTTATHISNLDTKVCVLWQSNVTSTSTNYSSSLYGKLVSSTSTVILKYGRDVMVNGVSSIIRLIPLNVGDYVVNKWYGIIRSITTLLKTTDTLNNYNSFKEKSIVDNYFNLNSVNYSVSCAQGNYGYDSASLICAIKDDYVHGSTIVGTFDSASQSGSTYINWFGRASASSDSFSENELVYAEIVYNDEVIGSAYLVKTLLSGSTYYQWELVQEVYNSKNITWGDDGYQNVGHCSGAEDLSSAVVNIYRATAQ